MIEQDPTKRTICIARTRYSVSHCAPIVDEAQRTFCIEAVKVEIRKYNQTKK
jgi:formyltetrahydrofolate synthetase